MPAVHQFVAGFANGDAISDEARCLRALFRRWGLESEIVSEHRRILPELRREARDLGDISVSPHDVALLHLSIGSDVNEVFASLRCRKAILYHNFTPPAYFETVNPQTARTLRRAEAQVRSLAGAADVVLADSAFNARELERYGYASVAVFPILLDFSRLEIRAAGEDGERRWRDGRRLVLFVGRGAPNKRIEDALTTFAYYHRFVDPNSRFVHVGSFAGTERYRAMLLALQKTLGLDGDDVCWAGSLSQADLNALYRSAHLFLCMSEHEGFCIPLIESMFHSVPVLALRAAAVPETLEGAGVLINRRDFPAIAEMMGVLATDTTLREAVLARQRARLARYRARPLEQELAAHLSPLLPKGALPL